MATATTGLIVDLLGFLTGAVLYLMLVVMVWRERAGEGMPFLARRGRLPLLTGVCGVVWNVGALLSIGMRAAGADPLGAVVVAVAFSALGMLPAVVVHSLLEGRETAAGRAVIRPAIVVAYAISGSAALIQVISVARGAAVPARPALWLLTGGFTALAAVLLLVTREQPIERRSIWVVALSVFAVSAFHFGSHVGDETWWTELIVHHASLPLALAILLQDYRFALADLFLKNAIALLLFMGVSLAAFTGVMQPLLGWQDASGHWDPRAIALFMAVWLLAALAFPLLKRLSARFVDRVVLRRPDYDVALGGLSEALQRATTESQVLETVADSVRGALAVSQARPIADPVPEADRRLVVTGPTLRASLGETGTTLLVRLRTVEPPHHAIACGAFAAGRRLLFDDVHLLETVARLAARRIDSLRVAQERLDHHVREQQMQRLATEAELRALRARLHPHFLFNALTTVGYLIQQAPERALDTLLQLTSVLRGVLRRSTVEFTTLGEEIDLVTSYLDIERARFEERLSVRIDVAPETRAVAIPALLLQPLVENAVRHGIAGRRAGGTIRVAAACEADRLLIVVEDTGVGFDPPAASRGAGVGLRSVADRLRVHYGARATLRIASAETTGTRVEILLPAEPAEGAVEAGAPARQQKAG